MLETTVIHHHHDQVNPFHANLQSPASSPDRYEGGCAPAAGRAARSDTTAVLAAHNETAFHQIGDHHNAFCVAHHFFRNPFVRGRHNGVRHIGGHLQTLGRILAARGGPNVSAGQCHSTD